MLELREVKGGWAVYSYGMRITAAMSKDRAQQILRHMEGELSDAA